LEANIFNYLLAACMGLGLAAAAGFRIFVPLLLAGLALRFELGPATQFLQLSSQLGFGSVANAEPWLASTPALIAFGVATALEIVAYKIPLLDNVLDAMGAPIALGAGALLATQFLLPQNAPMIATVLAITAGAGSAGIVHGATSLLRFVSTKTTGGVANPVVSFLELIASAVAAIMSLFWPIVAAIVLLVTIAVVLWIVKLRRGKALLQTLSDH
jgi:hypothetical protein